jgi:hypothetical protein
MRLICKYGFFRTYTNTDSRSDLLMHESEKAGVSGSLSETYMPKQKKTYEHIHSLQKYSTVETL